MPKRTEELTDVSKWIIAQDVRFPDRIIAGRLTQLPAGFGSTGSCLVYSTVLLLLQRQLMVQFRSTRQKLASVVLAMIVDQRFREQSLR